MNALLLALLLQQAPLARTTVGMPARVEQVVLPGSELVVASAKSDAPLVVRIVATWPHGDATRYDLEFWALEAGAYDLRERLVRADGAALAADELPAIPVEVGAVLSDPKAKPRQPAPTAPGKLGGYTQALIIGGVLWTVGLVVLLVSGRKKRAEATGIAARPVTLAERLRPLVERARDGQLSSVERAQLELSLVTYWRRKLGLVNERPEIALVKLREHAEAGPLLRALERWLHEPLPREQVDLATLLAPYRNLPPDALDAAPAAPSSRS
jgi:hypothetical protein